MHRSFVVPVPTGPGNRGVFDFFSFYPRPNRFGGYSDQSGVRPSVDAFLCSP